MGPDGARVHVATVRPGVVTVSALDLEHGEPVWETSIPTESPARDLALALPEEGGDVFVTWGIPGSWRHEGGRAAVDSATGEVSWVREGGSGSLAVGPAGEHLYMGWATAGEVRWDPWNGRYVFKDARIEVASIDPETGEERWRNHTGLWWRAAAPIHLSGTWCERGPVDLVVGVNGTVYASRAPECREVPLAAVGFSPDGELALTTTFPEVDEVERERWRATGLALHPGGHILYISGTGVESPGNDVEHAVVAALEVPSGRVLWSWDAQQLTENVEHCLRGPGCWEQTIHGVAATTRGEVLVTGFSDIRRQPEGRLAVLDGLTGEALRRFDVSGSPGIPGGGVDDIDELSAEISLAPDGLYAYVNYRASHGGRVIATPLAGADGLPWHDVTPPEPGDVPFTEVSVGWRTFVTLAGEPSGWTASGIDRGTVPQALSQALLDRGLLPADPPPLGTDGQRLATAVAYDQPLLDGFPAIQVSAGNRTTFVVNATGIDLYYVLVSGVDPFVNYTLQALPLSSGANPDPGWCKPRADPGGAGGFVGVLANGVSCGHDELCVKDIQDGLGLVRLGYGWHNVRERCRSTPSQRVATVNTAFQMASADEGDPGAVLFGPIPLVEGRYAVFPSRLDSEEGPSAAVEYVQKCWQEAVTNATQSGMPTACFQVHTGVDTGQARRDVRRLPSPVPVPGGGGGAPEGDVEEILSQRVEIPMNNGGTAACTEGWEFTYAPAVRNQSGTPTGHEHDLIAHQFGHHIVLAFKRVQRDGGCELVDFSIRIGYQELALQGPTSFSGNREWVPAITARGYCRGNLDGRACTGWMVGDPGEALVLKAPSILVPDFRDGQGSLSVDQILEDGDDRRRGERRDKLTDGLLDAIDLIWDKSFGTVLSWAKALWGAQDALRTVEEFPLQGDPYEDTSCGVGCVAWHVGVGKTHTFAYRPYITPDACGKGTLPVLAGPQELIYWAPDGYNGNGYYGSSPYTWPMWVVQPPDKPVKVKVQWGGTCP